jgi:hypothetical protein
MRRLALASVFLLMGCKPSSLKLADELDRSASWLATIAAVMRTAAQNRTPARYLDDTIRDGLSELASVEAKLDGEGHRILAESQRRIAARDTAWLSAAADTLSDLARAARK